MRYFLIDEQQIRKLRKIQAKLHSEERMSGDQMRDAGRSIEMILDMVVELEVKDEGRSYQPT